MFVLVLTSLCLTCRLVSSVVRSLGDVFTELKEQEKKITEIIEEEEASFCKTLEKGLEKFRKAAKENTLTGEVAFDLWATHGFPLDLTQLMAEEIGLMVDVDGFNKALNEAKERSRSAQKNQAGVSINMDVDATSTLLKTGVTATDDSFKYIWFQDHETEVKAIYTPPSVDNLASGDNVRLILASTSFYAKQGGQIYDTGIIEGSFGTFKVCEVKTAKGYVLHIGSLSNKTGEVSVGDKVTCKVDYERRKLIAPNHTCTHMLNFALKKVLGDHIEQKGSEVLPEKLRFDFSQGKPIDPNDLRKIEDIVNKQIKDKLDVFTKKAPLSEAKRIKGLREVLGEASYDPVRVVSIGRHIEDLVADPENNEWLSLSTEFCGGTHITNTGEAKAFVIVSEDPVAKGIRRITALTGECALDAMNLATLLEKEVEDASKLEVSALEEKVVKSLKNRSDEAVIPAARKADIKAKLARLQNKVQKAQKQIAEQNLKKALKVATEAAESATTSFCAIQLDVGSDLVAVRKAVLEVKEKKGMPIMVFSADKTKNKVVVYAGVPEKSDQFKNLNVIEWLKTVMKLLNGGCGDQTGKDGLASGQGTDATRVEEALNLAESFASWKLNGVEMHSSQD